MRCDFCGEAKPDVEIAGFNSVSNKKNIVNSEFVMKIIEKRNRTTTRTLKEYFIETLSESTKGDKRFYIEIDRFRDGHRTETKQFHDYCVVVREPPPGRRARI